MSRSSRSGMAPRRLLVAAAAALIPLVAGCEAGTASPSLQWHPPTNGRGATAGSLRISNAFVLGAPIGKVIRRGQNAGLFLAITNTGRADRLVGITAPGLASSVLLPGGHVTVNGGHSVLLTGPEPRIVLQDLLRPLTGGSVVAINLVFAKAGVVPMRVPVMPWAQYYTSLSPAPAPSKTSPAPSKSPSASSTP